LPARGWLESRNGLVGATLRLPLTLVFILVVLLVLPSGLFGRSAVRRV